MGSGHWAGGGQLDVVAAGQCWHWFDRPRVAAEAGRLLVPGGALLICHLSYLALPGDVCSATEAPVLERNPAWSMVGETGIYRAWAVDAAVAGVTGLETFSLCLGHLWCHVFDVSPECDSR